MFILLITGLLALIYGTVVATGAITAMRKYRLTPTKAALMGFIGIVIMVSALFIPFRVQLSFYTLIIGLISHSILTMIFYGKFNSENKSKYRFIKFFIPILIGFLAFIGLFSS